MKLKALDSFYSSETKQVDAKSIFEVDSPEFGKALVKRGLAEIIEGEEATMVDNTGSETEPKADAASTKSENAAPKNKAEQAPKNKGE